MPAPWIRMTPNYPWQSDHQNVSRTVERLYDVANLWSDGSAPPAHQWQAGVEGLRQVLSDARVAGKRVRAVGGNWSLSDITATSHYMVNTGQLNARTVGLPASYLATASTYDPAKLVFAQCGTSVIELSDELEPRGLSLKTSGASNGQTIAGAIATGTHGAANTVGAMQEYVVGLHVLDADGNSVWIERASQPVASDALLSLLAATPIRDDTVFRAAVVGLGAFGIVHAVVFEADPIYLLERYVRRYDYGHIRAVLSSLDVISLGLPDGSALPFHFEILLNPYATGAGGQGAYVRAMYKRPYTLPAPPAPGSVVSVGPGDDALSVISSLSDAVPALIPTAVAKIIALQAPPTNGQSATHGQTFGSTTLKGPGQSMELALAVADATNAVDTIVSVANRQTFGGLLGIRFVRATDALLGSTRFAPVTCTIEIPATFSQRSSDAYDAICAALDGQGIAYAMHWGQQTPATYDANRLRHRFGGDLDSWIAARRDLLRTPAARTMLSNEVTDRFGLGD